MSFTVTIMMSKAFFLQSIMKDAYDHHAAIYFLLLDRLKTQKSSLLNMGRYFDDHHLALLKPINQDYSC